MLLIINDERIERLLDQEATEQASQDYLQPVTEEQVS